MPAWEFIPILGAMDELIDEVLAYCAVTGDKPQRVLRIAIGASWNQWDRWLDGKSSPTLAVVDRLRRWMADHPAQDSENAA